MNDVIFGDLKNYFQIKRKLEIIVYSGGKRQREAVH